MQGSRHFNQRGRLKHVVLLVLALTALGWIVLAPRLPSSRAIDSDNIDSHTDTGKSNGPRIRTLTGCNGRQPGSGAWIISEGAAPGQSLPSTLRLSNFLGFAVFVQVASGSRSEAEVEATMLVLPGDVVEVPSASRMVELDVTTGTRWCGPSTGWGDKKWPLAGRHPAVRLRPGEVSTISLSLDSNGRNVRVTQGTSGLLELLGSSSESNTLADQPESESSRDGTMSGSAKLLRVLRSASDSLLLRRREGD